MKLSDIQKEIRALIQPHYLVEGIEDDVELKNTYFEKDKEIPSNIRPYPSKGSALWKIINFATYCIHEDEDKISFTREECLDLMSHIFDMYRILEYFNKDGIDFDRYIFCDDGNGHLWVTDRADRDSGACIGDAADCLDATFLTKRYFKEVERHWYAGTLKLGE